MADRRRRAEKRSASYYGGGPSEEHPLTKLGKRVVVMGDCWVVDGAVDTYPLVSAHSRTERANRYIWRHTHGVQRIARGIHIHHTCEVKGCINPNHLVAVEQGDHRRVHAGVVEIAEVVMSPADVEVRTVVEGSAPLR